jgi:hypothetical protein
VTGNLWRAVWRRAVRAGILAALIFLCGALIPSCRQPESTDDTGAAPSFHFAFRTGEQFSSDGWRTNLYGIAIDSTRARHVQIVVTTTGQIAGVSDAVVIADSAITLRTGQVTRDTAFFRLTAEGNIFRYGFLSVLAQKREGREIAKRWDLIYEAGSTAWTVGILDASGNERVYANLNGTPDYFSIALNANPTLIPAYRISMSGSKLDYYFWISDSPTCFPRLQEEPEPLGGIYFGERRLLTDRIAPSPGATSSIQARGELRTRP